MTDAYELSELASGPALIAIQGDVSAHAEFPLGTHQTGWHHHLRGQVFCVESGLVHVRTKDGSWQLPPQRAGWIPPGERHAADVLGAVSGWSLLLTPAASRAMPSRPCVFGISDLMRELVRRAVGWAWQPRLLPEQRRLTHVLLDEMRRAPRESLNLPMPRDRRLVRIATALFEHPDDSRSVEEWAASVGLSARGLSRLFQTEVQIGFAQWRQQARLVHALERLARGEAVGQVADALGYANPSAFIAMFRRSMGASPTRYFGVDRT